MYECLRVRRETRAPYGVARVSGVALRVSFPATSFHHYLHQRSPIVSGDLAELGQNSEDRDRADASIDSLKNGRQMRAFVMHS